MQTDKTFLGFDTSLYTTSVALMDARGNLLNQQRKLLDVPTGKRGLRQSDALFQHVQNLPWLLEAMKEDLAHTHLGGIGYSDRPRRVAGSYMPVFLAGASTARSIAASHDVTPDAFSHQEGHLAAGLWSAGLEAKAPFYAFHLSGGTTELLHVAPLPDAGFESTIVASAADISLGQLIDRTGVALGLSFPAGPSLEALAGQWSGDLLDIPTAVKNGQVNLSGPETLIQRWIQHQTESQQLAASLFHFAGKTLAQLFRPVYCKQPRTLLLMVGGVAANQMLRRVFEQHLDDLDVHIRYAEPAYCTDNAVGIASLVRQKRGRL